MKVEDIEKEILELNKIKQILVRPIQNDIHLIYRTYIETERLSLTKKIIDEQHIYMENGNKYQVNDISKLIESDRPEVDIQTKKLAQKILKANKTRR